MSGVMFPYSPLAICAHTTSYKYRPHLLAYHPMRKTFNSIFWRGSIYLARSVVNRAPQGWGVLILLCTTQNRLFSLVNANAAHNFTEFHMLSLKLNSVYPFVYVETSPGAATFVFSK